MKKAFTKKYKDLVRDIEKYLPDDGGSDLLSRAYWYGYEAHSGQVRRSGEPYFVHCVAAATILADLRMDISTIAASLLHDVVEDTGVTIKEVSNEFGEDIAQLVDGVTKITDLRFKNAEVKQAENFRKMLLSMARDIRVVMIKLADRLHNMQTLHHLPERKQKWIAQETLDVYAPLAHRFGIARLAWQLEDLCLKYLDREAYDFIDSKIGARFTQRMKYIDKMKKPIRKELTKLDIPCTIVGRPKSYYSVYKKMTDQNIPFEEIFDLLAMRIITEKKEHCYATVGAVHSLFTPVSDRFKDFVATPKNNGYQSIHTTVINPEGRMLEVQIRTSSMDYTAELGIAAHWSYKARYTDEELNKQLGWVRQFLTLDDDSIDPEEFMKSFKFDLFDDEIFVFTPKGQLISLPANASPVDFAFAVHTEVGLRCIGAKQNSKVVPLNTPLKNGDEIEILTSSNPSPQEYWTSFVATSKAQTTIKKWFSDSRRNQYEKLGKELLNRELENSGNDSTELDTDMLIQKSGYSTLNSLYRALARHDISANEVLKRVYPVLFESKYSSILDRIPRIWKRPVKDQPGLIINSENPLAVEISDCCKPIPGDVIVGFHYDDDKVVVHLNKCNQIPKEEKGQGVLIDWAHDLDDKTFPTNIHMSGADRRHLLRDIALAISELDINILNIVISAKDSMAICEVTLQVKDIDQLKEVMKRISKIKGIQRVTR